MDMRILTYLQAGKDRQSGRNHSASELINRPKTARQGAGDPRETPPQKRGGFAKY